MRLYGFENKSGKIKINFIPRKKLGTEIHDVSYRAILGFGIIFGLFPQRNLGKSSLI